VGEREGGEVFMKMMTALPAQKEEQEQQEREEMEISGFVLWTVMFMDVGSWSLNSTNWS
jgi:hypothetical protein